MQAIDRLRPDHEILRTNRAVLNVPYGGHDCLDAVAWRRGMDCRELLVVLEEAISVGCRCEESAVA